MAPQAKAATHLFQPPKGTRDFYPDEMAVRRYIEKVWRDVSINHGFDEIEGPTFEHLDLYTIKSGEEIVSQLFSFKREGGDTAYALRPEFTPTLARMYAARAAQLPKPTKWFCIPSHFRAERPQRGRLREFIQWNIDVIGDDSPGADAEVIACSVGVLGAFNVPSADVTVKISHREIICDALITSGVDEDRLQQALMLLDRKDKIEQRAFEQHCRELNLDYQAFTTSTGDIAALVNDAITKCEQNLPLPDASNQPAPVRQLIALIEELHTRDVLKWCEFDPSIVRGLAYYTGAVFEVIAAGERAIAGGGRYDNLIEMFGGPPTPAVGIAMGDVVIRLVLEDRDLLPCDQSIADILGVRPDVFVISSGTDEAERQFRPLIARLRSEGLHVRHSYRTTKNVGKLLGDAGKCHARFAVILGDELADNQVVIKNMGTGDQHQTSLDNVRDALSHEAAELRP